MGFAEFVIVIASIMALNPLAMDMMLAGAADDRFGVPHPMSTNRAAGGAVDIPDRLGVGQFAMGPLSDRFGAVRCCSGGMAVYCIASICSRSRPQSFRRCCWRGRCRPRHSRHPRDATSIVRDCYAGRRMASVMSLAMMVFITIPSSRRRSVRR